MRKHVKMMKNWYGLMLMVNMLPTFSFLLFFYIKIIMFGLRTLLAMRSQLLLMLLLFR